MGNSLSSARGRSPCTVHPHVRGEQASNSFLFSTSCGSSPRAWGTAALMDSNAFLARFIPTCVGNRHRNASPTYPPAVHPHVRGEQKLINRRIFIRCGSSPRAWGTGYRSTPAIIFSRFIPTCVGNRCLRVFLARLSAVHPHVRGEQTNRMVDFVAVDGSSPRAWGTGRFQPASDVNRRFIPTCVGNRRLPCQRVP